MVLAGVATVAPLAITDWANMIRSTVTNLAELTIRPDGSSLQGLLQNVDSGLRIPLVVSLGVPLVVSLLLATRLRGTRETAVGLCITLSTFFLLGSQAFINYWFLVAALATLAYALADTDEGPEALTRADPPPGKGLNPPFDHDDQHG